MPDQPIKSIGCCGPFDTKPWDDKESVWQPQMRQGVWQELRSAIRTGRLMLPVDLNAVLILAGGWLCASVNY